MSLKRGVLLAFRSLRALALAFVVIPLVNLAGGELAGLVGFPNGGEGRLAWDLGWVFVADVLAAWVVVKLAPRAPRAHAVVFFALALVIVVLAVVKLGADWPRWFSAGIVLTLPLQAWLGAWFALRGTRRGSDQI